MNTKLSLLLFLAHFSFYAQTNLIPNGGFENWTNSTKPTNWTVENDVKQNKSIYFRGFNSVQLSTFSTSLPKITCQVPMKAGITYTIKFKYKFTSSSFESSRFPRISLKITNDENANEYFNSKEIEDTEWRTFEGSFTADQNISYNFSISISGYQNYEFIAAIDEVMLYVQGTEEYTHIPDRYFELRLRDRGVDVGDIDGLVLTYWINTLTSLNLEPDLSLYITDLTGIQDFKELVSLDCSRNKLTTLDLSKNTALSKLNCSYNNLTTLDLSAQTKITSLECNANKITSLDLSKQTGLNYISCFGNALTYLNIKNGNNTAIYWNGTDNGGFTSNPNLSCIIVDDPVYWNKNWMKKKNGSAIYSSTCDGRYTDIPDVNFEKKLIALNIDAGQPDGKVLTSSISAITTLDVSASSIANLKGIEDFISLTNLNCSQNQLVNLDFSKHPLLTALNCESNNLYNLNLKNGKNTLLVYNRISFKSNPNLKCIQVDDENYSNANWIQRKDSLTNYSSTCTFLGTDDSTFNQAVMHPNPTKGELYIENISLEKANVYNVLGQLVKSFILDSSNTDNTINLSGLPKGVYYVYLINQDSASAKKVLVE
ncbi:T9SS type A sorting domain-containing protein [Flavobacterium sp. H4147]|uniref:T9SS type A sorting domain-containing protein n=1 Tax=Flavobacterium sp. H4147 TaxID=3034149 RepID=UPI0023ED7D65|nr:T9SS type A sorting domain-containing protein [Flavobacterium sp. H4147]